MTLGVAARYTPENQILPNPPTTPNANDMWVWAQDMTRTLQQNLGNIARKANDTSTYPLSGNLDAAGHDIINIGNLGNITGTITYKGADIDARYVNVTGDTMTGNLVAPNFLLDNTVSFNRFISYRTSGSLRFTLGVNTTAETGSNAGSNLVLIRYDDTGAVIDAAMTMLRSDGRLSLAHRLNTAASTTTEASINAPAGSAPTSPSDGDLWSTTAAFFARINGNTRTFAVLEAAQTWSATQTISSSSATPWIWSNTTASVAAAVAVGNGGGTNTYFSGGNYTLRTESTANILNGTFATNVQAWNMDSSGNVTTTGNHNIPSTKNYQKNAVNIPFQTAFESAQQASTAGTTLTIAHGLGVSPKLYMCVLQCVTASQNYSVGDEVQLDGTLTTSNFGANILADATNITVIIGTAGISIMDKTARTSSTITAANWKIRARAWA